ncbi:MAG: DUF5686 and carboxypeptidase regulatory-like domain-containing protein [Bacteroidales bacterium]|nr:DUF5686 and carboxypeptidase regulatory-like domain-containing protein [Bacteroidales bacterium]
MRRIIFLILVFISFSTALMAQVFKGVITDSENKPIPFSTVYIKELSFGTSANFEGLFELKIPAGKYTCTFQCMGYKSVTQNIAIDKNSQNLHIVLPAMAYDLKEVVITSNGEDPAYKIMRNVISKAPENASMVKSYEADVYIRGSMEIQKLSAMVKWMARDELKEQQIKEGDTYLEESVNEIKFKSPNFINQKVKSLHSTFPGNNQGSSSGAMGFITQNTYNPKSFGNAVSPITAGAFTYYRYQYEGTNQYGNVSVDKIKVIPKGDGSQYVSGYLYIIKGLWCIYSMDLAINAQLGTSIKISQSFAEVNEGVWLAVNNRYNIDIEIMDNKSVINYYTSIKYNKLEVNEAILEANRKNLEQLLRQKEILSVKTKSRVTKLDEQILKLSTIENPTTAEANRTSKLILRKKEIIRKDTLKNDHRFIETYKTQIDSAARNRDTLYWNKVRPIPLSSVEKESTTEYDSIQMENAKQANDSTRTNKAKNKKFFKVLMMGGLYEPDTIKYFKSKGLLYPFGINFNAVDGLVYKTNFELFRKVKKQGLYSVSLSPGYAFSRKAVVWDAGINFTGSGRYRQIINLTAGSGTTDFNTKGAMALENSVSSLFLHDNISRFYLKNYISLNHSIRISHELNLESAITAEENKVQENNTDFSIFYSESRTYKPNIPEADSYTMADHRNFQLDFTLSYKPAPYYFIRDGVKIPRPGMNNTPTLFVGYKKGIPVPGFETDFDLIKLGIHQKVKSGLRSTIQYNFEAGYFANSRSIYFNEFNHFAASPYELGIKNIYPVFQLMDYYSNSTDKGYVEGHVMYKTPMLLLKRLPLIRNRMWNESLSANYLFVPENGYHLELGYGIGNDLYNIGVYSGFNNSGFQAVGFRVSFSIFSNKQLEIAF